MSIVITPQMFWCTVALYTLLWFLVPWLSNTALPLDVLEGVAWGHHWQWGYYKHPPLPSWLVAIAFYMAGAAGAYALAAVNNGAALACVYMLVRALTQQPTTAALSALLLTGVYYYTWPTPEFNHNTLQLLLWPLNMWLFHRAITRHTAWCWPLALGLALLLYTKYTGIILLILMLMFSLWQARHLWRSAWFYSGVLLGVACMVPHVLWLQHNDFAPFAYAAQRARTGWPLSFVLAQVANHAALLLLWWTLPATPRISTPARRFILFFGLMPVLVLTVGALLGHQAPRDMWGTPLFSLSGALLLLLPRWRHPRHQYFWPVLLTLICAVPLVYGVLSVFGYSKRVSQPAHALAQQALTLWQQHTACELRVVAGDIGQIGLLHTNLASRPMVWIDHDFTKSPWLNTQNVQQWGYVSVAPNGDYTVVPPAQPCNVTAAAYSTPPTR